MVLQLHVGGAHVLFWKILQHIASKGSPIFLLNLGSVFSRIIGFVLKMMFSHTWLRQV